MGGAAVLKKFIPNQYVPSVYDIDTEDLQKHGVRTIITDLDNTLVEWDRPEATERLLEWLKKLDESGFHVIIVSNNNEKRVQAFASPHGIPFIHSARKPLSRAFISACRLAGTERREAVVVGDQLLTDILGGNRAGFHTILVVPVASNDGIMTKINRRIERRVMKKMKQKGLIEWERE
ncbi:YqeG family HAD IIIA-type phosphatase [Alkalicoccus chagannorensis]|uniref:YqeG family HAD IIIA-type phosphatase n=1 Tax=Alkalicoccus chagannorensis TaxID=427072 RepID=UPI00040B1D37|nr:YqeG family HAD IIIA-type phosphatase [Alkalicoccus chagannorensis]